MHKKVPSLTPFSAFLESERCFYLWEGGQRSTSSKEERTERHAKMQTHTHIHTHIHTHTDTHSQFLHCSLLRFRKHTHKHTLTPLHSVYVPPYVSGLYSCLVRSPFWWFLSPSFTTSLSLSLSLYLSLLLHSFSLSLPLSFSLSTSLSLSLSFSLSLGCSLSMVDKVFLSF